MSKSQKHTRSGADRRVSQANEAAIYPKPTGLCQHEIVSEILKKWKQCGNVQASCGCQVGHVCMGVRINFCSNTLQHFSFRSYEYAYGCLLGKGADWYPFCLGGGTGREVWGVGGGSEGSSPNVIHAFVQKYFFCLLAPGTETAKG